MKLAIVALLVCFSLCVSGQQRPRPGPPGPPRPRPHRKGPATAQEINQLLGNGLRHMDEERIRREPMKIGKMQSIPVQSDNLNVTANIVRGLQWLGRTKNLAQSTTKTNSSLEVSLKVEQEDITILGKLIIKGTINGNETEKSGKVSIRIASAASATSVTAALTRKSLNVTDVSVENSASAAVVNITETDLEESVVEEIQQAIADKIAEVIAEGQKIVEEQKEKVIEGLNKLADGKSLEEILDKLERRRPRPHGPPGPPGPRPHSEIEDQLFAFFSL